MSAIDKRLTLNRVGADLIAITMQVEGVSAALLALGSDVDGMRAVSPTQLVRALELFSGCCDAAVHKLGVIHDTLEDLAAEGQEVTHASD